MMSKEHKVESVGRSFIRIDGSVFPLKDIVRIEYNVDPGTRDDYPLREGPHVVFYYPKFRNTTKVADAVEGQMLLDRICEVIEECDQIEIEVFGDDGEQLPFGNLKWAARSFQQNPDMVATVKIKGAK